MANLLSGILPPASGKAHDDFYAYAMYRSLREVLAVYQGAAAVKSLDDMQASGRAMDPAAVARSREGMLLANLGGAMHDGAVLPGWNNLTGQMDWDVFSTFVRWFAKLPAAQKSIALERIAGGSETPWTPSAPRASGMLAAPMLAVPFSMHAPSGDASTVALSGTVGDDGLSTAGAITGGVLLLYLLLGLGGLWLTYEVAQMIYKAIVHEEDVSANRGSP